MQELLRVLIVDDEAPARKDLSRMIGRMKGFEVAGEAGDGLEAVRMIRAMSPDIVLLDIQMPGTDGFGVLERISGDPETPAVIFVTAYDAYALRAFEVRALDYLLKPVDEDRLRAALSRVSEARRGGAGGREIGELLRDVGVIPMRIPLRYGGNVVMAEAEDILFATVKDGEVMVHADGLEGVSMRRSLDELTADLPAGMFLRVHRSYIANIRRIHEIMGGSSGSYRLRMGGPGGPVIPASRQHSKELRRLLGI